jgi:hypothetical protein
MTKPLIGGKATFYPMPVDGEPQASVDATIFHVWGDTCVNVSIEGPDGASIVHSSVLVQEAGTECAGYYCVLGEGNDESTFAADEHEAADKLAYADAMEIIASTKQPDDIVTTEITDRERKIDAAILNAFSSALAEPVTIVEVHPIRVLASARELPEVEPHDDAVPFESKDPEDIHSFKSADGRTMRIVHVAGGLAAMARQ